MTAAAPAARPRPAPLGAAAGLLGAAGRTGVALHLLLAAAQALVPLLGLLAMQALVDAAAAGLRGDLPRDAAFAAFRTATLWAAGAALLGQALRSAAAAHGERHGRRLGDAVLARLQAHAAAVDCAAFDRPAFHDRLQRAAGEAAARPVRLLQDLGGLAAAALALLTMGALLGRLAGWLPVAVGAAALPLAWLRQRQARAGFAVQERLLPVQREAGYLGAVLTARSTAADVRLLGLAAPWLARLAELRGHGQRQLARLARDRALGEFAVQTLASAALFGAYLYLGDAALGGALSLGGLVLHAQAVQRLQNGVRDLLAAAAAVGEDRLFLQPLVAFLAEPPALRAAPPAAPPPPAPFPLQAAGLGFTYADAAAPALAEVAFALAPGERLLVVGRNGSGKSTLLKLLARLYDPTTGALRAGATDLRHVEPAAWWRQLAWLGQDGAPFERTLRDNLLAGAPPPPEAALWAALDAVQLGDRVRQLPRQLDTPLSRREAGGVAWSGGELRRLLLARVLLRTDAALWLLDEPFAHLDAAAAAAFAAALQAAPRQRTVVLADHRPEALAVADRVLWLDGGRVRFCGAPADLPAAAGASPGRA